MKISDSLKRLMEERERVRKATPAERMAVECWCGAPPGEPCLNHRGELAATQHSTRGMSREVVVALAKAAGLPWPR